MTDFTDPFGRPQDWRTTSSIGRSIRPCFRAFSENQFKGEKEVVDPLFGMVLRHDPVHKDAEFDGFGVRLVGQLAPLTKLLQANLRFVPNLVTASRAVNKQTSALRWRCA